MDIDYSNLKKMYRYTLCNPKLKIPITIAKSSMASYFRHMHKNVYKAQLKENKSASFLWDQKIKEVAN